MRQELAVVTGKGLAEEQLTMRVVFAINEALGVDGLRMYQERSHRSCIMEHVVLKFNDGPLIVLHFI